MTLLSESELREKLLSLRRPDQTDLVYGKTLEVFTDDLMQLITEQQHQVDTLYIGGREVKFSHTAVNLDAHLFIDGTHTPRLCPECIEPGTLVFERNNEKGNK